MPIRLGRFEMPNRLAKDEAASKGNYAKFVAEPFEAGYGHTLGNSLRRVLLSSLEGAAIASIKLEGAVHEFGTLPGRRRKMSPTSCSTSRRSSSSSRTASPACSSST